MRWQASAMLVDCGEELGVLLWRNELAPMGQEEISLRTGLPENRYHWHGGRTAFFGATHRHSAYRPCKQRSWLDHELLVAGVFSECQTSADTTSFNMDDDPSR